MKTVLIVDDEAALVRSVGRYLESFPGEFRVFSALSGEEGLGVLFQRPVDVLVTDVNMPGLDGISLVRRGLEIRPELRVIVMTAFGSPELEAVALREGAMRFLNKPVDLDELRSVIQYSAMVETGWAGMVGGLDLLDLAQLITLSGKTAVVHVGCGDESGVLVFRERTVIHASTGEVEGEEAFFRMALWHGGTFQEVLVHDVNGYPVNVTLPGSHLFMEAARRRDEAFGRRPGSSHSGEFLASLAQGETAGDPDLLPGSASHVAWREQIRDRVDRLLVGLESDPSFLGVAVCAGIGEPVAMRAAGGLDMRALAETAGEGLRALCDLSARLGIGRTDVAILRSPSAVCAVRGLECGRSSPMSLRIVLLLGPASLPGQAERITGALASRITEAIRVDPSG